MGFTHTYTQCGCESVRLAFCAAEFTEIAFVIAEAVVSAVQREESTPRQQSALLPLVELVMPVLADGLSSESGDRYVRGAPCIATVF